MQAGCDTAINLFNIVYIMHVFTVFCTLLWLYIVHPLQFIQHGLHYARLYCILCTELWLTHITWLYSVHLIYSTWLHHAHFHCTWCFSYMVNALYICTFYSTWVTSCMVLLYIAYNYTVYIVHAFILFNMVCIMHGFTVHYIQFQVYTIYFSVSSMSVENTHCNYMTGFYFISIYTFFTP